MRKKQKKNNENHKNDENYNTVVCNTTEIFVFIDKRVLDFKVT